MTTNEKRNNALRHGFGMFHEACALKDETSFFIGLRDEKESKGTSRMNETK